MTEHPVPGGILFTIRGVSYGDDDRTDRSADFPHGLRGMPKFESLPVPAEVPA